MEPTLTPDLEALASDLVSAVVMNSADPAAEKAAVIKAFDAHKDKIASDLDMSPLEIMILDWATSDDHEEVAYDALMSLARELVEEAQHAVFGKLFPSLKAALHIA